MIINRKLFIMNVLPKNSNRIKIRYIYFIIDYTNNILL